MLVAFGAGVPSRVSDQQRCEGGPAALAKVAEWMRLCECGHTALMHDLVKRKAGEVRTACSVTEAKTKCPCTMYEGSVVQQNDQ